MSESSTALSLPADFRAALKQCGLLGFFTECAYVHRAGYLHWVAAPVRRETRRQRIQQAVMRLAAQRAEVLVASLETQKSA
jgi:uncharacterized protein YdeI (YjbR/CyaY-like superfamily)